MLFIYYPAEIDLEVQETRKSLMSEPTLPIYLKVSLNWFWKIAIRLKSIFRMGFVTQDDVLFAHLTVRETLTYAALLRLPRTMTREQKKDRAMDAIYELGLER
ncbi:hypothetical protein GW17_00047791 [Ensete ventricosum]|nr:hypothetical protein GW17_00047791 [Ensete ventricosum]